MRGAARRTRPLGRPRRAWLPGLLVAALLGSPGSRASGLLPPAPEAVPGDRPEIALIIDDLGGRLDAGRRIVGLTGPVACAFLPHAPHTPTLAEQAHRQAKEVLLHLPMEAVERRRLDGGGLTLDMDEAALAATVRDNLARVPHVAGINNHMGSLLTRHPGHMLWLMRSLQRDGLFFVDSRTTKHTVARQVAYENRVPSVSRDVFLDDTPTPEAVQREFQRLLGLARRNGSALGIGHPHPATLALLERELPRLSEHGVTLVPVARLVQRQHERDSLWRASLSP
ncbi:MAG: divergent polysaccharide deacetylase family protein [Gammaproteobacteria bacterium]